VYLWEVLCVPLWLSQPISREGTRPQVHNGAFELERDGCSRPPARSCGLDALPSRGPAGCLAPLGSTSAFDKLSPALLMTW
jgi:hypothetical protein